MRVLFDTNVVFYWLTGAVEFRASLEQVRSKLRRKKAVQLVSAVTVQELEVVARHNKRLKEMRGFMTVHFGEPLAFDRDAARFGAKFASLVQRKSAQGKSEQREITSQWHRDASIAGIAHKHSLDWLITANRKDFQPFEEHMSPTLVIVERV